MYAGIKKEKHVSCKSLFKFLEELGADFVAAVALDGPQHALAAIVLQQRLAGLVELPQTHPPRLLVVVGSLCQLFARDVVSAGNTRFVEAGVVDPAAGRMHPPRRNPSQDDVHRRDERDDQVDGHERIQAGGLDRRPGEAV